MQIDQRFELPLAPAAAWPAFQDIALLVECLPGAALTGPAVDGDWPLRFDVRLGPIAAGFAGSGRVSFDDAAQHGRFEGAAADRKTASRVKGAADFALSAGGAGTIVVVSVDYALTGSLAQFSRAGIVRELANALTAQFAANLVARLSLAPAVASAVDSVDPVAGAAPTIADKSAPPAAIKPLAAGSLLRAVFIAWLRRCASWLGWRGR